MRDESSIKITHSTVLSKDGKPFVAVSFERGEDCAEGTVPDCIILRNSGFTEDEVEELEDYMDRYKKEIIEGAKKISSFKHWFGDT